MPDPTQPGQPTPPEQTGETFEFVDNHGKKYLVPKSIGDVPIQELFGHAIAKTRKDTKSKLESEYAGQIAELNSIKGEYETTTNKLRDLETNGLSAKDKEILDLKRKLDEIGKKQQQADESSKLNFEKFRKERITTDVMGAVTSIDVYNPRQTASLFLSEAQVELKEEDAGTYKTQVSMVLPDPKGNFETVTGAPTEVFKRWIALEGNAYLLKNNLTPGGGSTKGGAQGGTGSLTFTKSQIAKDPEARKRLNAAVAEGKADQIRVIED